MSNLSPYILSREAGYSLSLTQSVVLSVESAEFFNLNQERYINLKYECMRALKFCSLVAKIRLCQLLASLGCFTDEGRFCDVREFQYSKT